MKFSALLRKIPQARGKGMTRDCELGGLSHLTKYAPTKMHPSLYSEKRPYLRGTRYIVNASSTSLREIGTQPYLPAPCG